VIRIVRGKEAKNPNWGAGPLLSLGPAPEETGLLIIRLMLRLHIHV